MNQAWLEQFRAELGKKKLPRAYIERLVEEVSDHWRDLTEETMVTQTEQEVRMGEPGQVAALAASAYRRGLLERRPLLAFAVFVLLPLPALALLWLGMLYACAFILEKLESAAVYDLSKNLMLIHGVLAGIVVLSSALAAVAFGWLARWTKSGRRWPLASCVVLSLIAGLTFYQEQLSTTPGQSSLVFGVGLQFKSLWQAAQLCLALPLCLLGWRWQARTGDAVPAPDQPLTSPSPWESSPRP